MSVRLITCEWGQPSMMGCNWPCPPPYWCRSSWCYPHKAAERMKTLFLLCGGVGRSWANRRGERCWTKGSYWLFTLICTTITIYIYYDIYIYIIYIYPIYIPMIPMYGAMPNLPLDSREAEVRYLCRTTVRRCSMGNRQDMGWRGFSKDTGHAVVMLQAPIHLMGRLAEWLL